MYSGFGSSQHKDRFESGGERLSQNRIWKKLFNPDFPEREEIEAEKRQMARRMDRKTVKLEAAFGSERQFIVVTRKQDLIVRDLMEEVQRVFKIPIDEQVIFHKGTNLCDFVHESLETLAVENNHTIRVTRDPELPNRSPRRGQIYPASNGGTYAAYPAPAYNTVNYVNEVSPQNVSYQTVYQPTYAPAPTYSNGQVPAGANDVLKLYVSYGSEREYVLVHGKKPLMVYDLKLELSRIFKIPPDQQCIVFKGYNIHEYTDDAPLDAFGLENNSPISVWLKGQYMPDHRLPRAATPPSHPLAEQFSARLPPPPGSLSPRWAGVDQPQTEVLKVEVQHGSDRHQIILKGHNRNITVADLQQELQRITSVPIPEQRLFFKAQELHPTPYKTLKECDIENNHVIKMVGDPSRVRYSNYFGRLNPGQPNPNEDPNQMGNPYQSYDGNTYYASGQPTANYGYQNMENVLYDR